MKYLKNFKEAIINTEKNTDIDNFISSLRKNRKVLIPFDNVVEVGLDNNIEVVDYNTFYNDLPDNDKSTAPPRQSFGNQIPYFALVNPITKKPRLVLGKFLHKEMLYHIEDVLHHEMIHVNQHSKRTIDKGLANPNNRKDYYEDSDEIMAFSYSIAKELLNHGVKTPKAGIDMISRRNRIRLYDDIKKNVSETVLKKYHKYIYLYLEDLLKEKEL